MKKITAIYPGTFDPVTNGHLDIIERASKLFDNVIITIAVNSNKKPLFTENERVDMIKNVTKKFKNVSVDFFDGLLVSYAKKKKASVIIRGLRAISDFDYEFQIALTNRKLVPEVNTIFLMPSEKYSFLNSSLVRELASYNANLKEFVPEYVHRKLKEKYTK
ncbi:MAG: pantetheine-phosphate adenylyltransferase [Bacteroidetes bacterium]|nr:pantetheine-phosphate adenylyltransferase [Bacteroidota bacterium]MBX7044671.1 pantetheine-phosphate adenylyltransferase [Ignavibacteria bacterium]